MFKTKLLYKFDPFNKANFHQYIDKHRHIVFIFKTIYGKIGAAYSEHCFDPSGTKKGNALLLSLWNKKVFNILKHAKGVTYDEYHMIFGNSELKIKSLETKLFCNLGSEYGYFMSRGAKVQDFTGEKSSEVDLLGYEVYSLMFSR